MFNIICLLLLFYFYSVYNLKVNTSSDSIIAALSYLKAAYKELYDISKKDYYIIKYINQHELKKFNSFDMVDRNKELKSFVLNQLRLIYSSIIQNRVPSLQSPFYANLYNKLSNIIDIKLLYLSEGTYTTGLSKEQQNIKRNVDLIDLYLIIYQKYLAINPQNLLKIDSKKSLYKLYKLIQDVDLIISFDVKNLVKFYLKELTLIFNYKMKNHPNFITDRENFIKEVTKTWNDYLNDKKFKNNSESFNEIIKQFEKYNDVITFKFLQFNKSNQASKKKNNVMLVH